MPGCCKTLMGTGLGPALQSEACGPSGLCLACGLVPASLPPLPVFSTIMSLTWEGRKQGWLFANGAPGGFHAWPFCCRDAMHIFRRARTPHALGEEAARQPGGWALTLPPFPFPFPLLGPPALLSSPG